MKRLPILAAAAALLICIGGTGCESTAARENREAAEALAFLTTPAPPTPTPEDLERAYVEMGFWRSHKDAPYTGWNEVIQAAEPR